MKFVDNHVKQESFGRNQVDSHYEGNGRLAYIQIEEKYIIWQDVRAKGRWNYSQRLSK